MLGQIIGESANPALEEAVRQHELAIAKEQRARKVFEEANREQQERSREFIKRTYGGAIGSGGEIDDVLATLGDQDRMEQLYKKLGMLKKKEE